MYRIFLPVFMALWLFCQAQITEVKRMKEILVIFDIDMVLVQPSESAFQMANIKRFVDSYRSFMKQVPQDQQMLVLSLMTIDSKPVLIDEYTVELFSSVNSKSDSDGGFECEFNRCFCRDFSDGTMAYGGSASTRN